MATAKTNSNVTGVGTGEAGSRLEEQGNESVTSKIESPTSAGLSAKEATPSGTDGIGTSAASTSVVLSATTSVAIEPWEIAVSLLVLLLWISLLACGISVGTKPYIDAIGQSPSLLTWNVFGALLVIMLCHSATNSALCCCLAAFLGVIGSRAVPSANPKGSPSSDRSSSYASAATRGFFVYLILQSGAIVLSSDPFKTTTLEEYVRLVSLTSLIGFAVGFNPMLFQNLMNRVDACAVGSGKAGESAKPPSNPSREG